ncbi:MAG: transposase [Actinobacteria bacterium]|nr:transposase [Actinomycetota bacterium]
MDLTDEQWKVLEPLITGSCGSCTGAPWQHDLPERYPPYQSCHRRFQRWIGEGVLSGILEVLAEDLEECGALERVSKLEPYAESDLAPADHS